NAICWRRGNRAACAPSSSGAMARSNQNPLVRGQSRVTAHLLISCEASTVVRLGARRHPPPRPDDTYAKGCCCLQVKQGPRPPGRLEVSGPHAPWPTCAPEAGSDKPWLSLLGECR